MFCFSDEPSGILLVGTSGFWSPSTAISFKQQLKHRLDTSRRKHGHALSLIDGRESVVQSAEVMAHLGDIESDVVSGKDDRSALILTSSLLKMQAQRNMVTPRSMAFLSFDAARTWLLAYVTNQPGGGSLPIGSGDEVC